MPKLTLSFKGNIQRIIAVKDGTMTIGHDPSCDIHIDSLALQPVHARLVTSGGNSVLHDNGSEGGTFVNHKPIQEQALADNDMIRVGKHVLKYNTADIITHEQPVLPKAPPTAPPPVLDTPVVTAAKPTRQEAKPRVNNSDGWLQILSGKNLGKTLKLKHGMTNLSKHGLEPALITLRNEGYFISKLGDDTIRVGANNIGEKSWPLQNGDIIHIGPMQLQFYLQDN